MYCCGGITSHGTMLQNCERYDIQGNHWKQDVPNMPDARFSMTIMQVEHTWVYCFGGSDRTRFSDKLKT